MEFWRWHPQSGWLQIVPRDYIQYLERDLAEIHPPNPLVVKECVSSAEVSARVETFHQIHYSWLSTQGLPLPVPYHVICPVPLPSLVQPVIRLPLIRDISSYLLLLTLSLEPQSSKPTLVSLLKILVDVKNEKEMPPKPEQRRGLLSQLKFPTLQHI